MRGLSRCPQTTNSSTSRSPPKQGAHAVGLPGRTSEKGPAIRSGEITAADREFWSCSGCAQTGRPECQKQNWLNTDIDRFVLARLPEAAGIEPAKDAQPPYVRRHVRLTGLPPTPDALDAFLLPIRRRMLFAKVVDGCSPHRSIGEREVGTGSTRCSATPTLPMKPPIIPCSKRIAIAITSSTPLTAS